MPPSVASLLPSRKARGVGVVWSPRRMEEHFSDLPDGRAQPHHGSIVQGAAAQRAWRAQWPEFLIGPCLWDPSMTRKMTSNHSRRNRKKTSRAERQAGCLKDVPAHEHNVHKVGAVGHRLPEDSAPLPEWLARLATWPTKEQDDESTHFIDLVPVKDVEWAIQHSDSNGGSSALTVKTL